MPIGSGVAKLVAFKKETAWGAAGPVRTGARYLRRKSSGVDLRKATYQSEEIRSDYQVADMRHGVRSVEGPLEGEFAPGSYPEFFAALLRKDFAALTAVTGASITIGAKASGTYPLTRGAGSWITDGFKAGMVVRLSVGSFNANNLAKNLLIVTVTSATVLQVIPIAPAPNDTLTPEGPIATSTVTATGKYTYAPTSGHTDDSFAYEHWQSDITVSELFLGLKVRSARLSLPATGIAGISFDFFGKDLADVTTGRGGVAENQQYWTTPTAAASTAVLAAVNGAVYVGGTKIALITGINLDISGNMAAEPVVGSNTYPDINEGRVVVTGEMTALFEDKTLRDYFVNESEVAIIAALTNSNAANADFISFALPRVKAGGASKGDGERGIVQTIPFSALLATASNDALATTMMIQDSLAP